MVDDQDQQPTEDDAHADTQASAQSAPRRRRRAASRPAGPPVIPDSDQVELFSAPDPGGHSGDEGALDRDLTPAAGGAPTSEDEAEGVDADDEPALEAGVAEGVDADSGGSPAARVEEDAEALRDGAESSSAGTGAAPRRPRRATRGVMTVAFSAEPEPEAAVVAPAEVPVVAVFQPPDETKAVRRRRRPPVAGATEAGDEMGLPVAAASESDEADLSRDQDQDRGLDASADRSADLGEGEDREDREDRDEDGAPRRRRRRGGRRRRRGSGTGEDNGSADEVDDRTGDGGDDRPADRGDDRSADDSGADSERQDSEGDDSEGDESEGGESESSSARRRRRRRRRAGVAEEMEDLSSEDPPNTVVKVREARRPKDEITSVRGSTRIEAKKQRRRDGREAGRRRAPILTEAEFLARRESVNRVMCVREHGDRTQIAVLEDGILVEHYVNRAESSSMVGNVYLGKVQNVLPSMEAAFVDVGRGRNAVLYAGEVNWEAAGLEGQPKRIELALKSGDPVLVQVTKDPIGHKGARLTSQISLPGRFLVYVPEGSMTGISRKLPDTERARLKGILKDIVPDGAGVIVRTAAEGATEEQLTADVTRLAAQWADITKKAKSASPPSLLYGEPDLAIKVVRDIFNEDFTTLLVQGQSTWQTLSDYIGWVAPDLLPKLEKWVEPTDLYAAHRIDEQLAKALDRKVWLPSGGSLVIDRTEAMTVVDVNTGKFTGQGGNLEETVTKNNLEAAEEIVRQLRLRDIGGIIVVDFIDMVLESNRDLVLRRLVECLGRDRTKHQVAEVTSLGLVQMTRKRIGQGLLEVFSTQCEHCGGRGHLVSSEPVGIDQQPMEESTNRRERGGRRAAKPVPPVALGGKQTGKTPPPPKFDEHGHLEHDEHGHLEDHEAAGPVAGAEGAEVGGEVESSAPSEVAEDLGAVEGHDGQGSHEGHHAEGSHEGHEGHEGEAPSGAESAEGSPDPGAADVPGEAGADDGQGDPSGHDHVDPGDADQDPGHQEHPDQDNADHDNADQDHSEGAGSAEHAGDPDRVDAV
jgi:ribonuclease E